MKASDYIAATLHNYGVQRVFEVSGGMITHLLDSINRQDKVRLVSVHHEQAAAFAADAAGRMTGVPGVAIATSGPGATNLLTGMGSSYFDSSPTVFLTGQVNREEQKGDRKIRQLGFQETDIVSMAAPITKAAWRVRSGEELPLLLDRAFALATEGRPGPVLLDIPMDVQRLDIAKDPALPHDPPRSAGVSPDKAAVCDALDLFLTSSRPLVLIGGGIQSARAATQLRRLVRLLGIPVVNSLMAVDVLPFDDELRIGMIGTYGNRWANTALASSDCLLVLGSRLDVRQTGADTGAFAAGRSILHVDCEPGEVNNRVTGCTAVFATLPEFLEAAIEVASLRHVPERDAWRAQIEEWKAQWPDTDELAGVAGINPNIFMHRLSAQSQRAGTYVVDVGQHQMWAAQSIDVCQDQRFLTSGGMGSMGFALPAAIGAAVSTDRPVVLVAGDGGFQCNIQELQTVVRNCLPVKMVVINNLCHGMVRQFQESYFDARYQSTLWGYSAPDFERVACGYGITARTTERPDDIDEAVNWLWQDPDRPALLQVMVDTYANAYPKIAFGRPISQMEPFAKPIEMEST
ncbi:MAG TPA: thiamine pyrophosphate-binding protein [Terriglobales bacterium]